MVDDAPPTLAALQRQNLALSEQLRQLTKTESRLYRSRRQADEQLRRINTLNLFALEANKAADPTQILAQAADTLMVMFPFEQAVGLSCDDAHRLEPVMARSVPGMEARAAGWPAGFVASAEERAALEQPILFTDRPGEIGGPPVERLVGVTEAIFAEQSSRQAFYLVLPLWRREHTLLGALVARRITPAVTFHEPLPGERDLALLQLLAHHTENAVENATLMKALAGFAADLESRVRARTAELHETRDQLVLAGKMAAIGTLVAGLSHELNNPIGVILASAQMLLEQAGPASPSQRPLQAIERQARRCASLVNALLDFSRQREPIREPIEPGVLLERVTQLTSGHPRRRQVQLTLLPAAGLPLVNVCATELESALLNLINNAFDATSAGGAIEVRAEPGTHGGRAGVQFSVRDTGQGIPPDVLPRIFDPFFTTKGIGQGTGLGLSLTRKIVEAHDGQLAIDTRVGEGTTMRIWLPAFGTGAEQ